MYSEKEGAETRLPLGLHRFMRVGSEVVMGCAPPPPLKRSATDNVGTFVFLVAVLMVVVFVLYSLSSPPAVACLSASRLGTTPSYSL